MTAESATCRARGRRPPADGWIRRRERPGAAVHRGARGRGRALIGWRGLTLQLLDGDAAQPFEQERLPDEAIGVAIDRERHFAQAAFGGRGAQHEHVARERHRVALPRERRPPRAITGQTERFPPVEPMLLEQPREFGVRFAFAHVPSRISAENAPSTTSRIAENGAILGTPDTRRPAQGHCRSAETMTNAPRFTGVLALGRHRALDQFFGVNHDGGGTHQHEAHDDGREGWRRSTAIA